DALIELGGVLLTQGRLEPAQATLLECRRLADARGYAGSRAHADVLSAQVELQLNARQALPVIPTVASEAIRVFRRRRDHLGMSPASHTRPLAYWLPMRCEAACRAWEHAVEHARASAYEWAVPDMQAWVASALQLGPEPTPRAIERCEQLREDTRTHPF